MRTSAARATITVNTLLDELDGSVFDGDVSLRDALAVASAGDVIRFDMGFTQNLFPLFNNTLQLTLGRLDITTDVTIDGDINGDGVADITISGVGNGGNGAGDTGLILVSGTATLTLNGMNLAEGADTNGGAINIDSANASAFISNSLFIDNSATTDGGAIQNIGNLTIANSYFAQNSAALEGGAIRSSNGVTIVNSTLTQNFASIGGAINTLGSGSVAEVINSTVTGNHATFGGGVYGYGLNAVNSIVMGNQSPNIDDVQIYGSFTSNGHNIFGSGVTGSAPGDQLVSVFGLPTVFDTVGAVTVNGNTFDAGLVTDQTGVSPVIGIAEAGVAQDAGDSTDVPSEFDLGLDVNGNGTIDVVPFEIDASGFPRIVNGDVDIGASENYGAVWVVDTTGDTFDGDFTAGNLTLREAVESARDGDTITFDPTVFTADGDERTNTTINFTGNILFIQEEREITINGDVNGDNIADVTVDLSGASNRMMQLFDNAALNIESMTFANADTPTSSGAVLSSRGDLSILNSTFTNNQTTVYGGAIRIYAGTTTVANSTFDGNTAERGGAIRATAADVTIFNSTFYGNHASDTVAGRGGGAIEIASGTLSVINSTITGNTAFQDGGGIYATGGDLYVANSIVVGNVEGSGAGTPFTADVRANGTASSNGGNVFG